MFDYDNYPGREITVQSYKHDKRLHRSWPAKVISEDNEIISLVGIFRKEINHSELGVIRPGTISFEFYWKNAWYNVFQFHEPDGNFRNFYCNINSPPVFENRVLTYIDLDLDVLVQSDLSYQILDAQEFEENAARYSYSDELRARASEGLAQVITLIEQKMFPFDFQSFERLIS